MIDVFVNYRAADAPFGAAAIYELLATRFDRERIFLDNRVIGPGERYPDSLRVALESMRVLLVLIGPKWLAPDPREPGRLLIHDERDWVRQEIQRAFERSVRVVPILFDGARLPDPALLPEAVRPLVFHQAVEISYQRLGEDVAHLADRLVEAVPGLRHVSAGPVRPVPLQLPPAPRWFVGRMREYERMTEIVESETGSRTLALVGVGGIGKTWLALHWAHRNVERFPDGQLYVDLRGSSQSGRPMTVSTALRCVLDALGVDHRTIPVDLDAQIGRYRSLVAGRRMLIMLDNAVSASQVGPLLPGSDTCIVLVTSRNRLDGLLAWAGASRLTVGPLADAEARELFVRRLGRSRVEAEARATADLVKYCSGLPLALGIVTGRVGDDDVPLAVPAAELRDAATRVGALDTGEAGTSVNAALSWSLDALPAVHARMFVLLGLAPGPDVGLVAIAALVASPVPEARTAMRSFERVSLVQVTRPDRWHLHTLVRLYAAHQAEHTLSEEQRIAATRRVVDYYLHTAYAADRRLDTGRRTIKLGAPAEGAHPASIPNRDAAMTWFTLEHGCLLSVLDISVRHGMHRTVWRLAWVLHSFHWQRGHNRQQMACWRAALAAAEALDDSAGRAVAHRLLGSAIARSGHPEEAVRHLEHALRLSTELDDRLEQANAHRTMARVRERLGEPERSLEHAARAHWLYRELSSLSDEADALDLLCWYRTVLGDYDRAVKDGTEALVLYRELANREGEATALDSLGHLAQRTGRDRDAFDLYRQALELFHGANPYHEADTLCRLGEVCARLSLLDDASAAWQQCLELYKAQERTVEADRVQARLDDVASADE